MLISMAMAMMMMIMMMVKTIVMTVTTKIVTDPVLWSRLAGAHGGHWQNISLPCKLLSSYFYFHVMCFHNSHYHVKLQIKILTIWLTLTTISFKCSSLYLTTNYIISAKGSSLIKMI